MLACSPRRLSALNPRRADGPFEFVSEISKTAPYKIPMSTPSAPASGHWYCERCERRVHLADDLEAPARCPHCQTRTAVWKNSAAAWFAEMRRRNAEAIDFLPAGEAPAVSHPALAPRTTSPVPAIPSGHNHGGE